MDRIDIMQRWTPEYLAQYPHTVCEDGAWAAARIEELEAKLKKAIEMALDECPYREGSGSYHKWWRERRDTLAALIK